MDKAEAAMHSWQKFPKAGSTCEVRAWTDYLTYTKSANTIDFYLESKGNCGKLDYSAYGVVYYEGANDVTPLVTGYFSYKTPVKKAKLRTINVRPIPGGLLATLTKNGKFVGLYETKNLNFPNR